jgi:hypothetical protein
MPKRSDLERHRRRTCKHGDDTQDHFLYALDRAPALRCLLIHRRIISRGMQNGDADIPIGIDFKPRVSVVENRKKNGVIVERRVKPHRLGGIMEAQTSS